jgi:hypothetical protein
MLRSRPNDLCPGRSEDGIREDNKQVRAGFCGRRESSFDLLGHADFERLQHQSQCWGGGDRRFVLEDVQRIRRVPKQSDSGLLRKRFLQQLQALTAELRRDAGQAGDVATRPRQALDEPYSHCVATRPHHDRDHRSRLLGGERGLRSERDDDVDVEADELGCERGKPLRPALGVSVFDEEVLSLDVAKLVEPETESVETRVPAASCEELTDSPYLASGRALAGSAPARRVSTRPRALRYMPTYRIVMFATPSDTGDGRRTAPLVIQACGEPEIYGTR